eukprot:403345266
MVEAPLIDHVKIKSQYEQELIDEEHKKIMRNEIGSLYNGETNLNGQRHGKGRLTNIDVSYYEGSWANGKKEGQGIEVTSKGVTYEGNWSNNMKNGEGVLTLPSRTKIHTTWKNNKKNGTGFAITKTGIKKKVEFFEDNIVKKSDQNPDCYNWAPISLILAFSIIYLGYQNRFGNYNERSKLN